MDRAWPGGVAEEERDRTSSDFEPLERAADRLAQNRRAGRQWFLNDQIIKLLILRAADAVAADLNRDLRFVADCQLRERVAEVRVAAGEDAESARDDLTVEHPVSRLAVTRNLPVLRR